MPRREPTDSGRDPVAGVVPGTTPVGEEVLPGYRVVALLAHGRRVDTYDVWSTERECRCVLKTIRRDRAGERHVVEGVLTEGRLARDLTHPHLVRGYEVHEDPHPTLVLETLGGATLSSVLEGGTLGIPDLALLGLQVGSALSYLHRHRWLHLDVKPDNVVIDGSKAILIDLSLARRPGPGRRGLGTRGYLAPEQGRGDDLDTPADVWGLGSLLVEAWTGAPPFGPEVSWEVRRLRGPRSPRPLPPLAGLPADVDDVLRAALRADPAARPRLADVRAALAPFDPAQG